MAYTEDNAENDKFHEMKKTALWAKIVAITSIGTLCLKVINDSKYFYSGFSIPIVFYILMALRMIFIVGTSCLFIVFLFQFSKRTKNLDELDNPDLEETAVNSLRWYFSTYGIITLIAVSLIILSFIVALVVGSLTN